MLPAAVEWELRRAAARADLRGDELAAALGIEPGPLLGAADREVEGASFAGEVADRDEASRPPRAWRADE